MCLAAAEFGNTKGMMIGDITSRAAGLPDLSPCVPAPRGLSLIFEYPGPLVGGHSLPIQCLTL